MPNELIYYAVINNGINMTPRVIQKNKKKRRSNIAAA